MILTRPGKPWYAQILGDGTIVLNDKVPDARDALLVSHPNLLAAYDAQEDANGVLDSVGKLLSKKGALVGDDADVFEKVDKILKKRGKK